MKRLVTALAFLTSLAALIVVAGGGLALLAIANSGERGTGALLALGCTIAFASVMVLIFAQEGVFGDAPWRAVAIGAGIVGAIPAAALAFVAIRFAGLPVGSRMPLVDWTVLSVGILFGLGAIAILALGHRRSQEAGLPELSENEDETPVVHMQQIRNAQQQLRSAFEAVDRPPAARVEDEMGDGEIRVRRV